MAKGNLAVRAETAAAGWRDVYDAWFPPGLQDADLEAQRRAVSRWFRCRADAAGLAPLAAAARAGRLGHWAVTPIGRLLLILLAGPIPRVLFAGRAKAFAGEALTLRLAEERLRSGQHEALARPWERIFLLMPLAEAEGPRHPARLERAAALAERVVRRCRGRSSRSTGSRSARSGPIRTRSPASAASRTATPSSAGPRLGQSWPICIRRSPAGGSAARRRRPAPGSGAAPPDRRG